MNISFTFKNFEASEHLKKYARRRMEKLGRFFGKAAGLEVGVVLTVDKIRNRCEVTVVGEGLHLAASEQTNDMYAAIDLVYDKLESQIKKHVSRVKEQRRQDERREPVFRLHPNSSFSRMITSSPPEVKLRKAGEKLPQSP